MKRDYSHQNRIKCLETKIENLEILYTYLAGICGGKQVGENSWVFPHDYLQEKKQKWWRFW